MRENYLKLKLPVFGQIYNIFWRFVTPGTFFRFPPGVRIYSGFLKHWQGRILWVVWSTAREGFMLRKRHTTYSGVISHLDIWVL